MASHLKFNGIQDGAAGFAPGTFDSTHTLVFTIFVRVLSLPYGPTLIGGMISDNTKPMGCLWLCRPTVSGATRGDLIGVNFWRDNGSPGVGVEQAYPNLDIGSNFRIGRVYKLQVMLNGPDGTWSLGVDGVRRATGTLTSPPYQTFAGMHYVLGTERGSFSGVSPVRAQHMDIVQAMFERDRTLSFSGGFPTIDGDSDPFTDLALAGSASSDSALYLLNAGSGFPIADDSGNGNTLDTVDVSAPSWAGAADPQKPSPGVAVWAFDSLEGYSCRVADGPTIVPQPVSGPAGPVGDLTTGRLRLAPMARQWWEDGDQTVQFGSPPQLAAVASNIWNSRRSLRTANAGAVNVNIAIPNWGGATTIERWWARVRFYDPGGTTANRLARFAFYAPLNSLQVAVGVFDAQSTTHYVTTVQGAATVNQASSVARSAGFHELLIYISRPAVGTGTVEIMIDGSLERTEAVTISGIERIGFRIDGVTASNDDSYWDFIDVGHEWSGSDADLAGLVEPTGTRILPLLQPAEGVSFFRDVTITELVAGTDSETVGTTSYTFRHSTDGGSTWSSAASLTTANLRALACVGNGQDVLEITVAQTAALQAMASPATLEIRVQYEPALGGPFIDEEYRFLELQEA